MVGETNRAPFDLPEAEGELVGGFHTEYSSLKFALFFLAEYVNMVTVSALATTLFLGGWRAPWPLVAIWDGRERRAGGRCCGSSSRCCVFMFVFIWLRGTLPRLRYDQFMKLGWKVLIPVVAGLDRCWSPPSARCATRTRSTRAQLLVVVGGARRVVLLAQLRAGTRVAARGDREAERAGRPSAEFDPMAGGYPVPPMPGQTLPTAARASPRAGAAVDGRPPSRTRTRTDDRE